MRRVPGGADGEELRALVAAAEADLYARLLRGAGFPVLAPVDPDLEPRYLSGAGLQDDVVDEVELVTGDALDGPLLAVTTARLTEWAPTALQTCLDEIAELTADAGRPARTPLPVGVHVTVDGLTGLPARSEVPGLRTADLWVAVLDVVEIGIRVVVRGRDVPPAARLTVVDDLGPWTAARPDALASAAGLLADGDGVDPETLDLPPVDGFEAHLALVDLVCGNAEAVRSQATSGGRVPALPGDWTRAWEQATRTQMRLAGDDRRTADEAVTRLVNHVTALDEEQVLGDDPDARAAAVAESVRWTVFASQVPSEDAQLAWQDRWAGRTPENDLRWRTAWAHWLERRGEAVP